MHDPIPPRPDRRDVRRPRRVRRPSRPGDRLMLLTTRRRLATLVCPICAALVLHAGADAHARSHSRGDR